MRGGIRIVGVAVVWGLAACGGASGQDTGSEGSSGGSAGSTSSSGGGSTSSTGSSGGGVTTGGASEPTGGSTEVSATAVSTGSSGTTGETTGETTVDGTSSGSGASSGEDTGATGACSFKDPQAGLCWQEPPGPDALKWDAASAYCEGLGLRLPTVQELASLVRGCPAAMCPVEDPGCLSLACRGAPECQGCAMLGGPGAGGCYWDPALTGPCDWYWTASGVDEAPFDAWFVYFQVGSVDYGAQGIEKQVRCVRSDP
jgi:hypothetical protein